jgi:hypothetical protein
MRHFFEKRLRGVTSVAIAMGLLGCAGEVRVEGAGGTSSDGPSNGTGTITTTVTASTTGATSASTGEAFDVQAACIAACDHECVGGPNTCLDYCLEQAAAATGCEREAVAFNACDNQRCLPEVVCDQESEALYECVHIRCKDWSCVGTPESCACAPAECEEQHTRRATCIHDFVGNMICDCYEDDVLVTQCYNQDACAGHLNCCRDILENQ